MDQPPFYEEFCHLLQRRRDTLDSHDKAVIAIERRLAEDILFLAEEKWPKRHFTTTAAASAALTAEGGVVLKEAAKLLNKQHERALQGETAKCDKEIKAIEMMLNVFSNFTEIPKTVVTDPTEDLVKVVRTYYADWRAVDSKVFARVLAEAFAEMVAAEGCIVELREMTDGWSVWANTTEMAWEVIIRRRAAILTKAMTDLIKDYVGKTMGKKAPVVIDIEAEPLALPSIH